MFFQSSGFGVIELTTQHKTFFFLKQVDVNEVILRKTANAAPGPRWGSPPIFEFCAIGPNLPGQLSCAGAKRHGFNFHIVEHVDKQVAQRSVVLFVVGHEVPVIVATACKDDG